VAQVGHAASVEGESNEPSSQQRKKKQPDEKGLH
jgi:hypothetical protein